MGAKPEVSDEKFFAWFYGDRPSRSHDIELERAKVFRLHKYAEKALQGMLAHSTRYKPKDGNPNWHEAIAKEAFEIAQAMQAEEERIMRKKMAKIMDEL